MERNSSDASMIGALGAFASIVVAGAMVPLRDRLGNTNLALVLVLVVVVAASLGGRLAGAITSVVAALSYNFFLTRPYRTLRINDRNDIITVVLLVVVGLIVGELAELRSRSASAAKAQIAGTRRLEQVGALVSAGAQVDDVWAAVQRALVDELGLRSCRFESGERWNVLPRIERDGRLQHQTQRFTGDGFALPEVGVDVPVDHGERHLGRIVLEPTTGHTVTREQRRLAVALADQLAVVMNTVERPHSLS